MLRLHLRDGAVAAAKAWSHAQVEPRHVAYAIARHFRTRPGMDERVVRARQALDPHGSAVAVPTVGAEAEALLAGIGSADEALDALDGILAGEGGADGPGSGTATATPAEPEAPPGAPRAAEAAVQERPEADATSGPETVAAVLAELDALVGLDSVKEQVRRVMAVVQANQARAAAGHPPVNPGLHLVFTGAPGTGKTTVARLIGRLYAASGALPGSRLTEVGRSDLVAGYVGQTAIRTAEVLKKSRPGVLFIDEAYALAPTHASDFGAEALATLVKAMEDHRDELAVVVAGYDHEMEGFLGSNPGLRSRFRTVIRFPDYGPAELTRIFEGMVAAAGLRIGDGLLDRAGEIFRDAAGREGFGNARFARSVFERAYARMALRAAADGLVELEELTTLAADDLEAVTDLGPPDPRSIGFHDG